MIEQLDNANIDEDLATLKLKKLGRLLDTKTKNFTFIRLQC